MLNKKEYLIRMNETAKAYGDSNIFLLQLNPTLTSKEYADIRKKISEIDDKEYRLVLCKRTLLEKMFKTQLKEYTLNGSKLYILFSYNISLIVKSLRSYIVRKQLSVLPDVFDGHIWNWKDLLINSGNKEKVICKLINALINPMHNLISILNAVHNLKQDEVNGEKK